MRQAGKGIGQRKPSNIAIEPEDHSAVGLAMDAPGQEASKAFEWLRALGTIKKHWKLSAVFAAVVMATVVTVTIFTTPTYEATARIEVDPSGEKFSLNGASAASDVEYLETQAQLLQGDSLAIAIIRKLRLDQNPVLMGKLDPEASKRSNLKSGDAQQLTQEETNALAAFKAGFKVKRDTASRLILV